MYFKLPIIIDIIKIIISFNDEFVNNNLLQL
jgi:hypothetical protein